MWIDERQMVHTTGHSHWTDVLRLSPSGSAALRDIPPAWVHSMLDDIEDDLFDWWLTQRIDRAEEALYVDREPPRLTLGLIGPPGATLEILRAQLLRQSLRWRLDYLWALRDCLTIPDEGLDADERGAVDSRSHGGLSSRTWGWPHMSRGMQVSHSDMPSHCGKRVRGETRGHDTGVPPIRRPDLDSASFQSRTGPAAPIANSRPPHGERNNAGAAIPVPTDDGGKP